MDQLVPSNGRPISVNEYPSPLKPIANDIQGDTTSASWIIIALQPNPRQRYHAISRSTTIILTDHKSDFPLGGANKNASLAAAPALAYRFVHYLNFQLPAVHGVTVAVV